MSLKEDKFGVSVRLVESEEDHKEYVALRNELLPEQAITMQQHYESESTFPKDKKLERRFLSLDGELVCGFSIFEAYWQKEEPGRWELIPWMKEVDSEKQSRCLRWINEFAVEQGVTTLGTWMPTMRMDVLDLLAEHGYIKNQENPETRLELARMNDSAFQGQVDAFEKSELRAMSLKDFAKAYPDEWLTKYWDAQWEFLKDVPMPYEMVKDTLEDFEKYVTTKEYEWEWTLFALDGDEIVAMTGLHPNQVVKTNFSTGLTGTLREYRRRGIATALKVMSLRMAREAGAEFVYTDNEEKNPMLDINKDLGFDVYTVWWSMDKKF